MTYTSRDGTAWPLDYEEFIREHLAEFMRLGVQRLRSIHDADDAVANACKRIFERWEKIKYHPNPVAVARLVVRHYCIKHLRRVARDDRLRQRLATVLFEQPVTTADDILKLRGIDRLDRPWAALEERAPKQAECLRLRYHEAMSNAEIALALDCNVNAVKTNIHLGLNSLRRAMEHPDMGEGET
ncbi:RNA polymerase sigma factor [Streptomyces diastaticus]